MDEPFRLEARSGGEGALALAEPLSFEAFFEAEARTLFRRLCTVTGNSAEAEEIMQDAILAMWERWDRIDTSAPNGVPLPRRDERVPQASPAEWLDDRTLVVEAA